MIELLISQLLNCEGAWAQAGAEQVHEGGAGSGPSQENGDNDDDDNDDNIDNDNMLGVAIWQALHGTRCLLLQRQVRAGGEAALGHGQQPELHQVGGCQHSIVIIPTPAAWWRACSRQTPSRHMIATGCGDPGPSTQSPAPDPSPRYRYRAVYLQLYWSLIVKLFGSELKEK